ncbi:hydrolase, UxaA family domain protein [Burkholderia pseudomallei MSHR7498]|nr:hydrolase, UxaA family domain protein [Burkholderia pseudomallei]KGS29762.1 hydrolase, UxaA family domain protein [Burkholderia pseudomallei MSHR7343]KGS93957.1 hydrolase, UxaA family domain protein [Burkholderia pseudomallei MSHR7498]
MDARGYAMWLRWHIASNAYFMSRERSPRSFSSHLIPVTYSTSLRPGGEPPVHLIGFPGCYPNSHAEKMMRHLAIHPNVGAVLFVSLGARV